jgi:diguanylate cyclase (GGDEF)-like protein
VISAADPHTWPRPLLWLAALLGVALLGAGDSVTSAEVGFTALYLFPIAFAAWYLGRQAGLLCSAAAVCWSVGTDLVSRPVRQAPLVVAWNLGGQLFVFLAVSWLVDSLKQQLARERALSRTDELTSLYNRRGFDELARFALAHAHRFGEPVVVACLDLDRFKQLNDTCGHAAGDDALRALAELLRTGLRTTDLAARLGGDEFVVLLPGASPEHAAERLTEVRMAFAARHAAAEVPVTLSIGATSGPPATLDVLLAEADAALYRAKQEGRDRVVVVQRSESAPRSETRNSRRG